MPTKFYMHDATTTVLGTLPAAGSSISATAPTKIATGGGTNRSMNATIGVAQTSNVLATNAVTTSQSGLIVRFCSDAIAAQTISIQNVSVRIGFSESNLNSDFNWMGIIIGVWRPSDGTLVGRLIDEANSFTMTESTVQADSGVNTKALTAAQTAVDGDILVIEWWRGAQTQGMATSYNNTLFYDGTTEASTTSIAAYLAFTNNITMSTGAVANPPRFTPYPQLLAH